MANTNQLRRCTGCCIPQPIDQFQNLSSFKLPGKSCVKTTSKCISCQSSEIEMTDGVRKRTRTIANLAPHADPDTQVCTKCGHSKPLAHFVSYSNHKHTSQCSECRDLSLRAKGLDPPQHLFPNGGPSDHVWVVVGLEQHTSAAAPAAGQLNLVWIADGPSASQYEVS